MFDILTLLANASNHEERLVANDTINDIEIDTCLANDMGKDYETGLCINGTWYIAEDYDTKEEAQKGHEKYMNLIKTKQLKEIIDIYGAGRTEITYSEN